MEGGILGALNRSTPCLLHSLCPPHINFIKLIGTTTEYNANLRLGASVPSQATLLCYCYRHVVKKSATCIKSPSRSVASSCVVVFYLNGAGILARIWTWQNWMYCMEVHCSLMPDFPSVNVPCIPSSMDRLAVAEGIFIINEGMF